MKRKRCRKCGVRKSQAQFYPQPRNRDGLQSYCKECCKELVRNYDRRPEGKDARRERHLRYKYGLTSEQYEVMWVAQGGRCAICSLPEDGERLAVDHCHSTGRIRGLLCRSCNKAIGMLQDDVGRLARAIGYLTNAPVRPRPNAPSKVRVVRERKRGRPKTVSRSQTTNRGLRKGSSST